MESSPGHGGDFRLWEQEAAGAVFGWALANLLPSDVPWSVQPCPGLRLALLFISFYLWVS